MVAGLQHDNVVVLDHVDQAMLAIDPSGPAALEDMAQRLGLSDAGEGVTQCVLDEPVDPFQRLLVDRLPVEIVPTTRAA